MKLRKRSFLPLFIAAIFASLALSATALADGYTAQGCTIDRDGEHYARTYTSYTNPDCTHNGYFTCTCNLCGETFTVVDSGSALGHSAGTAREENRKDPTCTEAGSYDSVVYCSRCGIQMSRTTTTIAALGHAWDEGVVTVEAGELHDGETTYTCTRCGTTTTDTISVAADFFSKLRGIPTEAAAMGPDKLSVVIIQDGEKVDADGDVSYLSVKAEGGYLPYSYQWYCEPYEGEEMWNPFLGTLTDDPEAPLAYIVQGATDAELTAHVGNMHYCCVVTDATGESVTSEIVDVDEAVSAFFYDYFFSVFDTYEPEVLVYYGEKPYSFEYEIREEMWTENGWEYGEIIPLGTGDSTLDPALCVAYGNDPMEFAKLWNYTAAPGSSMYMVVCTVTDNRGDYWEASIYPLAASQPYLTALSPEQIYAKLDGTVTIPIRVSLSGGTACYNASLLHGGNWSAEQERYMSYSVEEERYFDEFGEELGWGAYSYDYPKLYEDSLEDYYFGGSAQDLELSFEVREYGSYQIFVRDAYGMYDGLEFEVVAPPLEFAQAPQDGVLDGRSEYAFTVEMANGTAPYTYELFCGDTVYEPRTGATANEFFKVVATGTYRLVVTDSLGATGEVEFTVSTNDLRFDEYPDAEQAMTEVGQKITLSAKPAGSLRTSDGYGLYEMTWYEYSSATGEFSIMLKRQRTNGAYGWVQVDKPGIYRCELSDGQGNTVYGRSIFVRYTGTKPFISVQPEKYLDFPYDGKNTMNEIDLYCSAYVGTGSSSALSYQWLTWDPVQGWVESPFFGKELDITAYGSSIWCCRVTNTATGEYAFSNFTYVVDELSLEQVAQTPIYANAIDVTVSGGYAGPMAPGTVKLIQIYKSDDDRNAYLLPDGTLNVTYNYFRDEWLYTKGTQKTIWTDGERRMVRMDNVDRWEKGTDRGYKYMVCYTDAFGQTVMGWVSMAGIM